MERESSESLVLDDVILKEFAEIMFIFALKDTIIAQLKYVNGLTIGLRAIFSFWLYYRYVKLNSS